MTVAYLVLFCTLFAFYVQNYAVRRNVADSSLFADGK